MSSELENAIDQKVKPIVSGAMQKFLGVKVANIESDISDQLKSSTLLDIPVNAKVPFKQAKKAFKRAYLMRLLKIHLGNISTAAAIAGVDRRSIHRLVLSLKVPTLKFREDAEPSYARQAVVQGIIQGVLGQYKSALNPVKYKAFSRQAEGLSEEIVKELPEEQMSLKDAEHAFEKAYLGQLLKECSTIAQAAKQAKLRYEVLHRKLRNLGIKAQKA
jgi:DNA-binding NtrC family response regulator